jgi:hypothetical protein
MRTWIVAVLTAAAVAGCGPSEPTSGPTSHRASQPAVALGQRYYNLAEGYSLCPPIQADRVRERLSARTVTWIATDRATGGLEWVMAATRKPTQLTADQLAPFAERLNQKGATLDQVAVESCRVITVAGRPAIDLRGLRTDKKQTWTRQVLIFTDPGELLTLSVLTPAVRREEVLAIHQAVLGSLQMLDRRALTAQRNANLVAGRRLLATLTAGRLAGIIEPRDHWMLILRDGQVEGCMVTRDRRAVTDGRPGVESRTWMRVTQPDGTLQRLQITSFVAADRSVEQWTATIRALVTPPTSRPAGEQVLVVRLNKQGRMIELNETLDGKATPTVQKVLGESMDRSYLPMAMQPLVPHLADLSTPGSYAFASFAPQAHELDVYTFTVVGPGEIEWEGHKTRAVRATIRSAEDEEAQDVWLDPSGRLLRQNLSAGACAERSTRQEVLRRVPAAREMLEAMDAQPPPPAPLAARKETR